MIVCRIRRKIISTVLCVVYHNHMHSVVTITVLTGELWLVGGLYFVILRVLS